ncbi:MAG TPA: peptidoglycan-binding domain-containing protein [Stellaceae bacterium]|nr:peptidoglycan-binding domain-containing protein [Stellaceae bacterium]
MDRRLFAALVTAGALAMAPAMAHQVQHPRQAQMGQQNEFRPDAQQITQIQQKLDQEGFKAGRPDGKWGPQTARAVKEFQQQNNLPATGRLDEQTLAQLGVNQNGGEQIAPQQMTGSSQPPQPQASPQAGDSQSQLQQSQMSGSSQMSKEQAEQTLKDRGYQQVQLSEQNGKLQGTAMKGGKQYEVAVSQSGEITETPMH